jgi:hypothetical protein
MTTIKALSMTVGGFIRDSAVEAVNDLARDGRPATTEAITTIVANTICLGDDVNGMIASQIAVLSTAQEAVDGNAPVIQILVAAALDYLDRSGELIAKDDHFFIHPCSPAFAR